MKLKRNNQVNAMFQMSSLTDIIFLLLIFFMLTSTLVAPNAIKVKLPSATGQTLAKQSITLSITEENRFYLDDVEVQRADLESAVVNAINSAGTEDPTVVLRADKATAHEFVIDVLKLGPKLDIKVILATQPE
ncbi:MAG: biopolymer transporter ExbD [Saprospiraceae bacterium]|nr:biopolymer transporter ExbD [Saprospiraceae bacterium]